MSKDEKKYSVLEAIEAARKAQQKFYTTHDVQLEMDVKIPIQSRPHHSQKKHAL